MYRLSPHSTSDNDLAYRTKEEVEENWKKDGIPKMKSYLIDNGLWSEEQDETLLKEIHQQLKEAVEAADNSPFPKPEDTLLHVYASEGEGQ
ncbi:2-oxoisovalerate dehydrogenase subunit alpha [compost metagenome]